MHFSYVYVYMHNIVLSCTTYSNNTPFPGFWSLSESPQFLFQLACPVLASYTLGVLWVMWLLLQVVSHYCLALMLPLSDRLTACICSHTGTALDSGHILELWRDSFLASQSLLWSSDPMSLWHALHWEVFSIVRRSFRIYGFLVLVNLPMIFSIYPFGFGNLLQSGSRYPCILKSFAVSFTKQKSCLWFLLMKLNQIWISRVEFLYFLSLC